MNIIGEQGSLSSRFLPPMSRNIHYKAFDRVIFRQTEHMTKDSFNKGGWFCEAVDGSIWHPVDSSPVE